MQTLPITRCRTDGFAGYALAWSPFFPGRLALASSQNFGLVGNGRLHLLGYQPQTRQLGVEKAFDTQDGLYDLAWSETHENQIVSASGDGSIKLWDIALNDFPIRNWHEHQREVFSVDWNNLDKSTFASSSWDHTIKLWRPELPHSLQTIPAHSACVYAALFSPSQPQTLASVSSDGFLKVWDLNSPTAASGNASLAIPAHPTEILSLDWNKYQPFLVATGSVDRTVKIHDIRKASSAMSTPTAMPGQACVETLLGHDYAIRKVAWSPHSATLLASASYDMSARIWNAQSPGTIGQPPQLQWSGKSAQSTNLRKVHTAHTEFVVGLAWSLYEDGLIASCSWDTETHLWPVR
ncbi:uncharacterized protein L969DRAFT_411797 [Mixia osmundae IAM 14324]|uniref:Peroxin-7 n=1 Tax=Mixia osmundae (strain CBS 9802 / IAM 14324 / JCM 22182 / KY 12970) TaxID=764103 RepID=G7E8Y1_MIXOS|nr:uncharacterized protein L969DRAFT_411797 [Mixia osmundae IAM 14324]KEI40233.1 hypothetical protein L969DRAFT_411797 [Mixia osmundae IAM 14324]GAA99599.1 hypothetical protein E5Q_06300 [Mixia osmundae IAM 14324]